jgi:hypothetical protein
MVFPLITRISADWMLKNPRPSAKSAEEFVVGLDLWIEANSVLSVSSCKNILHLARTGLKRRRCSLAKCLGRLTVAEAC